jgi:hypothetical protein
MVSESKMPSHALFPLPRPAPDEGFARRVGLRSVLAAVLGGEHERARVGRYALLQRAGAGGMGIVYRATDGERDVALKLLERPGRAAERRFAREAELLARLEHPGIVKYLEHGTTPDGAPYLVMEWLEGCDLATHIRAQRLTVPQGLALTLAAARALAVAHESGVIHRDLKPSNLYLVNADLQQLKVIDFGIARDLAGEHALTSTGDWLGTPAYMAPEQLRGAHDARTDVYGLGATLYECLAGQPPFVGEPGGILSAVLTETPVGLAARVQGIPPEVDALVSRMLAKDPAERPKDLGALALEIAALMGQPQPTLSSALSAQERALSLQAADEDLSWADAELPGRSRELALFDGLIEECCAESALTTLCLSGEPGVGKTALLRAYAARSRAHAGVLTLDRFSTSRERGAPFAALAGLAESAREQFAADGRSTANTQRLLEALIGLQANESSSAVLARDPRAQADALTVAWLEAFASWCQGSLLLLVLDDIDTLDSASARLLDRAIRAHAESPLLVLSSVRSPSELERLPPLWREEGPRVMPLRPLRPRAALRVALASSGDRARALQRVEFAEGNPGRLLDACRMGAVAEQRAPDAARLAQLDEEARRFLRAVAVAGAEVSLALVAELMGTTSEAPGFKAACEALVRAGCINVEPQAGSRHEVALQVRDPAVVAAAYARTTDEDRERGHATVAAWLERRTAAPERRAEHWVRARQPERAAQSWLVAARLALVAEDLELVESRVNAGLDCQPSPKVRAALEIVRAHALFWGGALEQAERAAERAREVSAPGTAEWFYAASLLVTASGQRGAHDRVQAALLASRDQSAEPGAEGQRWACLCRGLSQALATGGAVNEPILSAEDELGAARDSVARAWFHRFKATEAGARDFGRAIGHLLRAREAHLALADERAAAQISLFLGSYYVWTGAWTRARSVIEDAHSAARQLGSEYLELWADYTRGKLWVEVAPLEKTRELLERVVAGAAASPRIRAGALTYLAIASLRVESFELAQNYARAAAQAHDAPVSQVAAWAAELCARSRAGRLAEAKPCEERILAGLQGGLELVEFQPLVHLALAEYAEACGDREAGEAHRAGGTALLEGRIASLGDPVLHSDALNGPHLHRALRGMTGR